MWRQLRRWRCSRTGSRRTCSAAAMKLFDCITLSFPSNFISSRTVVLALVSTIWATLKYQLMMMTDVKGLPFALLSRIGFNQVLSAAAGYIACMLLQSTGIQASRWRSSSRKAQLWMSFATTAEAARENEYLFHRKNKDPNLAIRLGAAECITYHSFSLTFFFLVFY